MSRLDPFDVHVPDAGAASGGTPNLLDNPMQRAVRDLMAIRMPPAANFGSTGRTYGRLAFGLESKDNIV